MPLPLFLIAVVAMTGLAILRLVRVHRGHTPLPEGKSRTAFLIAFLVVPPVVLKAVLLPTPSGSPIGWFLWVPLYAVILGLLVVAMTIAAMIVERTVNGRWRRPLMLALVGSEGDPEDIPFDPPVTTGWPSAWRWSTGPTRRFPAASRSRARSSAPTSDEAWGALDGATSSLEGSIADDRRLGLGIATAASATALDARGRLDTLLGLANDRLAATA